MPVSNNSWQFRLSTHLFTAPSIPTMRAKTYQIRWHWDSATKTPMPVYSLDFHHFGGDEWRLATCGADKTIKMWKVVHKDEGTAVTFLGELAKHNGTVNCVRFSPNGRRLASASDDKYIIIWELADGEASASRMVGQDDIGATEAWRTVVTRRQHNDDIYDIAWSPDSTKLLSGSVDNTAILWDVASGTNVHMTNHSHFVQGVAWDPLNRVIATQSSDRSCIVQQLDCLKQNGKTTKFEGGNTETHRGITSPPVSGQKSKTERLFVDENKCTFFRRLCFTPDGSLLLAPAGRFTDSKKEEHNTLYIFRAVSPSVPIMRLSGMESSVVAVRCSPILYKLKDDVENVFTGLKHRMIFAVATRETVILYDTQQTTPFGALCNLHYAPLSDLAWSADGRILAISSEDGFCSIVSFKEGELGEKSEDVSPLMDPGTVTPATHEQDASDSSKCNENTGAKSAKGGMVTAAPVVNVLQPRRKDAAEKINVLQPKKSTNTPTTSMSSSSMEPKINVLTPRRLIPTKVEPAAANDSTDDRPPKVRRIAPELVSTPSNVDIEEVPCIVQGTEGPRRLKPVLISAPAPTDTNDLQPDVTQQKKPRRIAPSPVVV